MQSDHPMLTLKEKLAVILTAIPAGSDIIFLDVPIHGNIGDLLLWSGTEQFFAANGTESIRVTAFTDSQKT